jgi:hypothetical protein
VCVCVCAVYFGRSPPISRSVSVSVCVCARTHAWLVSTLFLEWCTLGTPARQGQRERVTHTSTHAATKGGAAENCSNSTGVAFRCFFWCSLGVKNTRAREPQTTLMMMCCRRERAKRHTTAPMEVKRARGRMQGALLSHFACSFLAWSAKTSAITGRVAFCLAERDKKSQKCAGCVAAAASRRRRRRHTHTIFASVPAPEAFASRPAALPPASRRRARGRSASSPSCAAGKLVEWHRLARVTRWQGAGAF